MQNIDPVVLLGPSVYVVLSAGLLVYWQRRRRLSAAALALAGLAYFTAIGLKVVVQYFTYGSVVSTFGAASLGAGIYFGLQTSVFEVGLAYLFAVSAVRLKRIDANDAEGYGVSLAFWENGVLLGALSLFELIVTFALIANGLLPQQAYQTIVSSEPSLFYPPSQLLFPAALGVMERVSSFLVHFSWGYLCVLAAYLGRKRYLLIALPMGLVDVLVPFAVYVPTWVFEVLVFLISVSLLLLTWRVTKKDRKSGYAKQLTASIPTTAA